MKKRLTYILLFISLQLGCAKSSDTATPSSVGTSSICGTYKSGQKLYLGSEGGCYYINSNGNKTYVERSACKCN